MVVSIYARISEHTVNEIVAYGAAVRRLRHPVCARRLNREPQQAGLSVPRRHRISRPGISGRTTDLLASKSTLKDRWRQVLPEAQRIPHKHLFTLEPGISENQTTQMQAERLQLVIPQGIHGTYRETQRQWLMSMGDFIRLANVRQQ